MIPETPDGSEPSNGIPVKKFKYPPVIVEIRKRVTSNVDENRFFTREQLHSPDLFSDMSKSDLSVESAGEKSPPNDRMASKSKENGENGENIEQMVVDCEVNGGNSELVNCIDVKSNCADENTKIDDKVSNYVGENPQTAHNKTLSTPKNAFGPSLDTESQRINIDELIAALVTQGDPIVASQHNPVDIDAASISVNELIQIQKLHHDRISSLLSDAQKSS